MPTRLIDGGCRTVLAPPGSRRPTSRPFRTWQTGGAQPPRALAPQRRWPTARRSYRRPRRAAAAHSDRSAEMFDPASGDVDAPTGDMNGRPRRPDRHIGWRGEGDSSSAASPGRRRIPPQASASSTTRPPGASREAGAPAAGALARHRRAAYRRSRADSRWLDAPAKPGLPRRHLRPESDTSTPPLRWTPCAPRRGRASRGRQSARGRGRRRGRRGRATKPETRPARPWKPVAGTAISQRAAAEVATIRAGGNDRGRRGRRNDAARLRELRPGGPHRFHRGRIESAGRDSPSLRPFPGGRGLVAGGDRQDTGPGVHAGRPPPRSRAIVGLRWCRGAAPMSHEPRGRSSHGGPRLRDVLVSGGITSARRPPRHRGALHAGARAVGAVRSQADRGRRIGDRDLGHPRRHGGAPIRAKG